MDTSKELFDVVDENNELTGLTVTRLEAHKTGAWHRTVHVYYFRQDGEQIYFLVHLRAKTKDLKPNCWDTRFGGHVRSGETVKRTVVDEMKEEIGLQVSDSDLIESIVRKHNKSPNREFTHVFFYQGSEDTSQLKFEDDEVQEIKWMESMKMAKSMRETPDIWAGSLAGFDTVVESLRTELS
jgi:isopentenyl-diphosphate Delta-isomerase